MSIILNYINYFWKLGFNEEVPDLYLKKYSGNYKISIDIKKEVINYGGEIKMGNKKIVCFSQKNFIILEAFDRALRKGNLPEDIHFGKSPLYDFVVENISSHVFIAVKCLEWEKEYDNVISEMKSDHSTVHSFFDRNKEVDYLCVYTSRLKAGLIEYNYTVFPRAFSPDNSKFYLGGLFEEGVKGYFPSFIGYREDKTPPLQSNEISGDFTIINDVLMEYTGTDYRVIIPKEVEQLRSSVFWNFTNIQEVVVPNNLFNLGGDTFFSCVNLHSFIIPRSVRIMGDNPFAICPKLDLFNESPHFILEDGALYNKERTRLIYYAIKRKEATFGVPDGVISIGKHSFCNCHNLRRIIISPSVRIMENNPFSNLPQLRLENKSPYFSFIDGVLYNKTMTTLIYYEHETGPTELSIPDGVRIIGRHSFYSCKRIKEVIIPKSIEIIGYNPFANCPSLTLVNHSPNYICEKGILYNKIKSELIYYPISSPEEMISIPITVRAIGRSAFYKCTTLKEIIMPDGVTKIGKSAFADCTNIAGVSLPHSLKVIEGLAFANCINLFEINVPEHTSIEANAFYNCPAKITRIKEKW
ncbi:MAG: leucine-rich repeat domain-containing protein [Thermoplasmataceae archaeon]